MAATLDIVVTCTGRKVGQPRPDRLMRNAPRGVDGLVDVVAWRRALSNREQAVAARSLYQGGTWAASLALETEAKRYRGELVTLWVLSAGYGLIPADHPVVPYAATFSATSEDYVGRDRTGADGVDLARRWWDELCRTAAGTPRSLQELAATAAGDVLMVLSEAYLRACRPDVVAAAAANTRALVVAPSAHAVDRLRAAAPPFDARLLTTAADERRGIARPLPSGTRMSLNVGVGRLLVERFGPRRFDRGEASAYLGSLTSTQPPLHRYEGQARDDVEVRAFIAAQLAADPAASKTVLLRRFRDGGNRCEQKRFGRLFDEVAQLQLEGAP